MEQKNTGVNMANQEPVKFFGGGMEKITDIMGMGSELFSKTIAWISPKLFYVIVTLLILALIYGFLKWVFNKDVIGYEVKRY